MALPFNRVNAALASKLVDAAENNALLYRASRHSEQARIFSQTEHTRAPTVLLFSKKVWDTLGDEDRALIREAARDSSAVMRRNWDAREAEARTALKAAGVEFVTDVDRQAFKALMQPVYARDATGPAIGALVAQAEAAK